MDKPDDYNIYFNEDGTKRKCPYEFMDFASNDWMRRQREIAYMLMSDVEKEKEREFRRYQEDKYSY